MFKHIFSRIIIRKFVRKFLTRVFRLRGVIERKPPGEEPLGTLCGSGVVEPRLGGGEGDRRGKPGKTRPAEGTSVFGAREDDRREVVLGVCFIRSVVGRGHWSNDVMAAERDEADAVALAAVAIEDSEVVVARHAAQRATDRHPVLHCRAAADRLRDAELQARPLHDGQTWNSQG